MRTISTVVGLALALSMVRVQSQDNRVVAPAGTVIHSNLPYVAGGHERQVLDLYLPAAGPRPLATIIIVHGGRWAGGDKAANPQVAWGVPKLLQAGYAVASVNHRYSQQAVFPAQIHDVKAAVRWLRANAAMYGLDPQRFGAWGMSSGGHLVALLGTSAGVPAMDGQLGPAGQDVRVQAVVDWFGPTDVLQMDAHRLANGLVHNATDSPESQLIGGPIQTLRAQAAAANPITYVTRDDPPFLIFHGDSDPQVPHHQSELLQEALTKNGVSGQLQTLPGAGHGTPEFRTEEVWKRMLTFFDQHVKTTRS